MSKSEPTDSFLALIRAAEEGEVDETLAEVLAKLEVSEGDEGEGKSGDSPEEKRPRGLGPEGRVQADAVRGYVMPLTVLPGPGLRRHSSLNLKTRAWDRRSWSPCRRASPISRVIPHL